MLTQDAGRPQRRGACQQSSYSGAQRPPSKPAGRWILVALDGRKHILQTNGADFGPSTQCPDRSCARTKDRQPRAPTAATITTAAATTTTAAATTTTTTTTTLTTATTTTTTKTTTTTTFSEAFAYDHCCKRLL